MNSDNFMVLSEIISFILEKFNTSDVTVPLFKL